MKNEGRNRNGNTEMKINGVYSSQNLSHKCSFSIISKISNVIYTLNGHAVWVSIVRFILCFHILALFPLAERGSLIK